MRNTINALLLDLDNDTLKHIQDFLDLTSEIHFSSTSHAMRKLSSNRDTIDLSSYSKYITDNYASNLTTKYSRTLQNLNLKGCKKITDTVFQYLVDYCNNLKAINLSDMNITDSAVTYFSKKLLKLNEIDLSDNDNITDSAVYSLTDILPKLQKINLANTSITKESVNLLAEKCIELIDVDISENNLQEDDNYDRDDDDEVVLLTKKCTKLQKINLSELNISDASIDSLSENCKQLQVIYLFNCYRISSHGLQHFFKNSKNLQEIELSNDFDSDDSTVTDEYNAALAYLSQHGPGLKKITLHANKRWYITDDTLINLAFNCNTLQYINIKLCNDITNLSIRSISNYCKDIEEIHLTNVDKITSAAIEELDKNCTNLKEICMSGCDEITAHAIKALNKKLMTNNSSFFNNVTEAKQNIEQPDEEATLVDAKCASSPK